MNKLIRVLTLLLFCDLLLTCINVYSQFTFIHITDLHLGDGNPAG